jgi:hypothetical protein
MHLMKALTIVHEDHPGLLAEVATLLEGEGVVVQDFAGHSVGDTAVISLTVEQSKDVFRLLSDAGYRVIASEHLLVRLEKHPGALAELSRRLAEANVDVRGMHIVNKDEKAGIVALETLDHEKAREVLRDILVG